MDFNPLILRPWAGRTEFLTVARQDEILLRFLWQVMVKNFLQNLLIFFALSLCALIAFQWVRETHLRATVQSLTDSVHDKTEAILNLQATVRRDEDEIKRLDGLKNQ